MAQNWFRSKSELRVAQTFNRMGILYFPNAKVSVPLDQTNRVNWEIDFLVAYQGRVAIVEVDGGPCHPPERSAYEHERDRRFRERGLIVERFDSSQCYNDPESVVQQVLRVMSAYR